MTGQRFGRRKQSVLYCIVPTHLAGRLGEPLRRWFLEDFSVEVVAERRYSRRRSERGGSAPPLTARASVDRRGRERRRRSRRPIEPLMLPAAARACRNQLVFARLGAYDERQAPGSLLARLADGEMAALAELYLRYQGPIYTHLRHALGNHHDAEDLTHTVLLKVAAAIPNGAYAGQPLKRWLSAVERNALRNCLNKKGRLVVSDPNEVNRRLEQEGSVADEPSLEWLNEPRVRAQFDRLKEREQQVLMLSFVGDLSPAQIARALDSTENSISATKSQAIKTLRERLENAGGGDADPPATRRAEFGASRLPGFARRSRGQSISVLPRFSAREAAWRGALNGF